MTDIRDNNLHKCNGCDQMFTITDPMALDTPCPKCGVTGKTQIPFVLVCDFCSNELGEECWTYPAEDFFYTVQLLGVGPQASKGGWACCDECHDLIEEGLHDALAVRSHSNDVERGGDGIAHIEPMLFKITKQMQADFFAHRTGPAFRERVDEHFDREEKT